MRTQLPRVDFGVELEVRRPVEGLPAQAAGKGGRPLLVDLDVRPERGGLRKAQPARAAGEGPLPSVDAHMRLELVGAREGLGAQGAAVGALARVDLHVPTQRGSQGEVLAADFARKGALAGVGAQVVPHGGRLEEALSADITYKRALASVDAQVALEVIGAQELLLAHVALVWPVTAVRLAVGPQTVARGVGLAAELALVRRVRGQEPQGVQGLLGAQAQLLLVLSRVVQHRAGQGEGAVTHTARDRALPPVTLLVPLEGAQVQEVLGAARAAMRPAPQMELGALTEPCKGRQQMFGAAVP